VAGSGPREARPAHLCGVILSDRSAAEGVEGSAVAFRDLHSPPEMGAPGLDFQTGDTPNRGLSPEAAAQAVSPPLGYRNLI